MRCCAGFFRGNRLSDPEDLLLSFLKKVPQLVLYERFTSSQRSDAAPLERHPECD
jgi:hypothetical protein